MYCFMLNDLYSSPNIFSVDKVEKNEMGGACSAYGGEEYTGIWLGKVGIKDHLGKTSVDGRIILKWIFRQRDVGEWNGSSWLRIRKGGGHV